MGQKNDKGIRKPIRIPFTDKTLKSIKNNKKKWPKKSTIFWREGGGGYGIRVSPRGKISFVYRYKFNGEKRLITIGSYPKITLAGAYKIYGELAEQVEKGGDPCSNKRNEKRLQKQSPAVEQFVETYIEGYCKGPEYLSGKRPEPKKRTWAADKRMLEVDVVPDLGKIKMVDVTTKDIRMVINQVYDRGSTVMSNRLLSCLNKMFSYGVDEGILEINVCSGLKKKTTERARERILNHDEIKQLWVELDNGKGPYSQNRNNLIKMLLITGQRSGETRLMEWSELDGNTWTIPASKAKNKTTHMVPLPPLSKEIIESQRSFTGGQKYVFAGWRKSKEEKFGERCFDVTAISHAFEAIVDDFKWERTTPHDLRRTMRSELAKLKVGPIIAEKVLNHKMPGVMAVYDRYDYIDEKAVALQKWNACLEGIVYPERKKSNVVELIEKLPFINDWQ